MIKLLVDCFGGDLSPQAPVEGALAALAKNPDLHLLLTGDETILRKELEGMKSMMRLYLMLKMIRSIRMPGEEKSSITMAYTKMLIQHILTGIILTAIITRKARQRGIRHKTAFISSILTRMVTR